MEISLYNSANYLNQAKKVQDSFPALVFMLACKSTHNKTKYSC